MAPHGWRESVGAERTTFRFAHASIGRRVAFTLIASPLWYLGADMTVASIRAGNWGGGYVLVAMWDLLALFIALVVLDQFGRTRIDVEPGAVTWTSGPFPRTRDRLTFEEAATVAAQQRTAKRSVYYVFSFRRGEATKRLGTTLDDAARAQHVLERLDAELVRREPGLRTIRMTSGL